MSNASFTFFSPRDLSWPDLDLATYRLPTITFGNMVTFFGKFYTCSRSFSMRLFKHRLTRLSTTFHSRDSRGSERPPPQRRVDYGNIPAGRGLKGIVHIEKMELLVWKHSTTCKNNIPGITLLKFYQIKKNIYKNHCVLPFTVQKSYDEPVEYCDSIPRTLTPRFSTKWENGRNEKWLVIPTKVVISTLSDRRQHDLQTDDPVWIINIAVSIHQPRMSETNIMSF